MVIGIVAIMMVFILIQFVRGTYGQPQNPYTQGAYEKDLAAGNVTSVEIVPNQETPTGSAIVTLSGGAVRTLYATDITKIEELTRENGVEPVVDDVPRESWFMTSVLPMLLVAAVCLLFFYLMSAQQMGGGGANARMMNFGKSRAQLADGKDRRSSGGSSRNRQNPFGKGGSGRGGRSVLLYFRIGLC